MKYFESFLGIPLKFSGYKFRPYAGTQKKTLFLKNIAYVLGVTYWMLDGTEDSEGQVRTLKHLIEPL